METDLGCVRNPDGSLRDASEIEFFHDVDDEHRISGPSSLTASSSTVPIHLFLPVLFLFVK
jgi:hypothetical protein